jgi:VanZ family protein
VYVLTTTRVPQYVAQGFREPRWWLWCLAYLVFVVYGSLVPLEWREVPWDDALTRFSNIRYLDLGAASRADWVANIVLYVPLAFLACCWLFGLRAQGLLAPIAAVLVFLGCVAIAIAVEFTQIFFEPRTVSLNDLLAEGIGAAIGVSIWLFGRWRIVRLGVDFARGGRASVLAALAVFSVGYLLLSLFPYDFVVSRAELHSVLGSRGDGVFSFGCANWLRCAAFWLVEVLAIAPLGLLLALLYPRWRLVSMFALGIGIGLVLEPLQLLLVSGTSHVWSVLFRGLGVLLGALLGRLLTTRLDIGTFAALAWRSVPWLVVPYVLAVSGLSGWWNGAWSGFAHAGRQLANLGWVPFYYHYWTSEPVAMASLLSQLAMYAPIGMAFWARTAAGFGRGGAWWPAMVAALLAVVIEVGKLFAPGTRPDPTNLIIAPTGAWLAYGAAIWFGRVLAESGPTSFATRPVPADVSRRAAVAPGPAEHMLAGVPRGPQPEPDASAARSRPGTLAAQESAPSRTGPLSTHFREVPANAGRRERGATETLPEPSVLGYLYAVGCGAAVTVGVVLYPLGQFWLAAALLLFGAALWRWPSVWLAAVPAALPVLDLTPWSGQLVLTAFDLFVLVALGVVGLRLSGIKPARLPNAWFGLALLLLWLSWFIAMAIGLAPSAGGELPSAASHPPLAPWHEGKGLLWALLAVPLLGRFRRSLGSTAAARLVLPGAVIGLALVCANVLYERVVHVGLFDLDDVFRVTGPFASMHDGGAYIEAYLAFAFPMLLVWIMLARRRGQQVLGAVLVLVVAYAMLVTFSRGGYGGFAVGAVVVVLGLLAGARGLPKARWWALVGVLALVGVAAVPALTTGFAGERLSRIGADLDSRLAHWRHAVGLMGEGALPALFGEGFGRYPALYLFSPRSGEPAGSFEVRDDNGNPYLRLGKGEAVYLDQRVSVRAGTAYRLTVRVRAEAGGAKLSVPLCEKALLYSFTCVWSSVTPDEPGQWQTVSLTIQSDQVGRGGRWPLGPVKLSLYNAGAGRIDVDEVGLKAPEGRELITNGGFDDGAERWLFVTDQDLAWHIHEQFVEIYFAQGLLGLLATAVLLIAAFAVLLPAIRAGRHEGVAFAGALAGFLSVGLLGSTVDAPRTAMLFYLGLFCAALLVRGADKRRRKRRSRRRDGAGALSSTDA